jgi:hypothetical protein
VAVFRDINLIMICGRLRVLVLRCEKLIAEAGFSREPRERRNSAIESRYQAKAIENWEDVTCAIVTMVICVCVAQ